MTKQILKSALRGDVAFAAKVTAHCAELNAHAAHMAAVGRGEADPYPPPFAPALIAQAIVVTASAGDGHGIAQYVEDYEIIDDDVAIDDGPTPEQAFAQKQQALLAQVAAVERAALNAILPEGKRRVFSRQVAVAMAVPQDKRTPDQNALIAENETLNAKFDAVDHHAAVQMAAIEDLTADTIDAWQMPPFPAP